jgi:SHS family lactate transporter-like MFS transporter
MTRLNRSLIPLGVFAAWTLSACAFWTIPFAMTAVRTDLRLTGTETALLVSVTLAARFAGALIAGAAAELRGRRLPLLVSIAVCGVSGGASAAANSYDALLIFRALFGMGLGGVWVAGFALALEDLTGRSRGVVSGLLQGGWNWGYLVAAFVSALAANGANGAVSWRILLRFGALPLLTLPLILSAETDSPRTKRALSTFNPFAQIFTARTLWVTIHTAAVMAAFMALYYCVTTYYPALVSAAGFKPLWFVVALNGGAIGGGLAFGRISSTRLGRRGTIALAAAGIPFALPLYLGGHGAGLQGAGGFLMGLFALGMWGVVPRYLAERFPEQVRAIGPGFAYHGGALLASASPLTIGAMLDHGIALRSALEATILVASLVVAVIVCSGPEAWRSGPR